MARVWDDYFGGYIDIPDQHPPDDEPKGIWRENKDTVSINGKLWHTPEAVLDRLEYLEHQIEFMRRESVILHAIFRADPEQVGQDVTTVPETTRAFVDALLRSAASAAQTGEPA